MARIYVIDDDEQLLRMVGLMLERGGHSVTLFNNPVDGLENIKTDKPDLLVLDVMMPYMSGHDLAKEIRNSKGLEDLPILILTARAQEVDRTAALKVGADDYLSKPVTSQELIERVDSLLAKKSGVRAEPDQGFIIVFFGLRGGVGQTTLAVNMASALRRISQQEVCLVDFSPSGSQVVTHMRLQARTNWGELPAGDDLNWEALKGQLIIHPSSLRVLASSPLPQEPGLLSEKRAARILDLLRQNSTFTIIDAPNAFTPALMASLKAADMALHVISPEVVSVQTAVQVNRAIRKAGITVKRKSHILNQTVPEAQLPQTAVERGLNTRVSFQVGYDANQSRAMAQGVPLTLTSAQSAIPTVVRRMAEAIWQRVSTKSM
ncbi:MAG: response regulator [Anaerolineales bacterium]|nr:response regulator [Anaerolineales bacterium]